MNKHIEKYLDLYLSKEDVEYATLLTGKWGCGKTFFIKNYIKNHDEKHKFVYVSLFGLKDITAVNQAIFQELHPFLSNKRIKFLGGVLASVIKLGFKVDLVGDDNKETTINIDPSKLNPFDAQSNKDLVFIFDDLERTMLPLSEILGFINLFCEKQNVKVIVITNEDEIEDDKKIYKKFKEKVIGKTFNISNNIEDYWNNFNEKYEETFKQYSKLIKSIFETIGDGNYRNLNQTIENYIDFTRGINPKYFENPDFTRLLTEQFFTLSLDYRKEHDITKTVDSLKEKNSVLYYQLIFEKETWKKIITDFYINFDELNELISSFPMFRKEGKMPSWRKLCHYRELNNEEFNEYLNDVKTNFIEIKYDNIGIIMHAVNMLIFFIKNNLCEEISIDDIENKTYEYLALYKEKKQLLDIRFTKINGTGLGYLNEDDHDFIRIRKNFFNNLEKQNDDIKADKTIEEFYKLLEYIKIGDWENTYKEYEKYQFISFLRKEHAIKVMEILGNNLQWLYNFCYFLDERYPENHYIDGRSLANYLSSEEGFIDEMISQLSVHYQKKILDPFENFKLNEILNMLNLKKKRFKK